MTNRYDHVNFLARGKGFGEFWKQYLSGDKRVKYIMGLGFDPRTMNCFTKILECINSKNIDCKVIEYGGESSLHPLLKQILERNTELLESHMPRNKWASTKVNMADVSKDVSLTAAKSIQLNELSGYTDIILDITAMPTSVYFPITRNILDWISKNKIRTNTGRPPNFHMVVSENSTLDNIIRGKNIDENITYMYKFAAQLQREANSNLSKVWIPLLGEGQSGQLSKISQQVSGLVEFCPFFPMPSVDPYRSKNLLMEHRELLADDLVVGSKDYVYAHETNPFDVCRKIYNTAQLYYDLFRPLGGCKVVISPLSNKLMCVGALLATCELLTEKLEVGIVYVAARGYDLHDENIDIDVESQQSTPYSMWLAGDCYV